MWTECKNIDARGEYNRQNIKGGQKWKPKNILVL